MSALSSTRPEMRPRQPRTRYHRGDTIARFDKTKQGKAARPESARLSTQSRAFSRSLSTEHLRDSFLTRRYSLPPSRMLKDPRVSEEHPAFNYDPDKVHMPVGHNASKLICPPSQQLDLSFSGNVPDCWLSELLPMRQRSVLVRLRRHGIFHRQFSSSLRN